MYSLVQPFSSSNDGLMMNVTCQIRIGPNYFKHIQIACPFFVYERTNVPLAVVPGSGSNKIKTGCDCHRFISTEPEKDICLLFLRLMLSAQRPVTDRFTSAWYYYRHENGKNVLNNLLCKIIRKAPCLSGQ